MTSKKATLINFYKVYIKAAVLRIKSPFSFCINW